MHNFGKQTQKNSNKCFGVYLYSAGTQNGNPHQLSVMMCRVTYLLLWANTRAGVCHSQHRKNLGKVSEKNAGEWTGGKEISKEEIAGSRDCLQSGFTVVSLSRTNLRSDNDKADIKGRDSEDPDALTLTPEIIYNIDLSIPFYSS